MSFASTTVTTPERGSQQYLLGGPAGGHAHHHDVPTKIVEDDEDVDDLAHHHDQRVAESEGNPIPGPPAEPGVVGKHAESLIHRPSGARISALGGPR
jgi:hypothetical protein